MLILTRKVGQNIRIGEDVRIVVMNIKDGQVKLGIDAPPTVPVHREEIYQRIHEKNKSKSSSNRGGTFARFFRNKGLEVILIASGLSGLASSAAGDILDRKASYELSAYEYVIPYAALPDALYYSPPDAAYASPMIYLC